MAKKSASSQHKPRTIGRALAFQAMFQEEINPGANRDWEQDLDLYLSESDETLSGEDRATALEFARRLFDGCRERKVEIDAALNRAFNTKRTLTRTMLVDRNILRVAAFEMLYLGSPKAIVISEAIKLGKTFGDSGARAFLNGVLDHLETENAPSQGDQSASSNADSSESQS